MSLRERWRRRILCHGCSSMSIWSREQHRRLHQNATFYDIVDRQAGGSDQSGEADVVGRILHSQHSCKPRQHQPLPSALRPWQHHLPPPPRTPRAYRGDSRTNFRERHFRQEAVDKAPGNNCTPNSLLGLPPAAADLPQRTSGGQQRRVGTCVSRSRRAGDRARGEGRIYLALSDDLIFNIA